MISNLQWSKRQRSASTSDMGAKPGLSLIGNLGDEVSATRNMGSTVIGHGREGMAFVFRMPMISSSDNHGSCVTFMEN